MRVRSISAMCCVVLTMSTESQALAQSESPLDAGPNDSVAFLESARTAFEGPGLTMQEREAIAGQAWRRFFASDAFVSDANTELLVSMLTLLGRYRGEVAESDVVALTRRLDARFASDSEALLSADLDTVMDYAKALQSGGRSPLENVALFTDWMVENDWRSLQTHELYNLFGFVSSDAIDRTKFSARWTGRLTAPRTGDYVFRQKRAYRGVDSQLVVTLDGMQILDSRSGVAEDFQSTPVRLTAGQPVEFVCELTHDSGYIQYSAGAPMALVTWEGPGASEALIPAAAFSYAAGEGESAAGLAAEYFGDLAFGDLLVSRVDPTLDLVWTWPPTAPLATGESRQVFSEIVNRLLDDRYLRRVAASDDEVVALEFDRNLWRIAYRMNATERQSLVSTLRRVPEVLERLSPEAIGRLFRGIYMLPSGDQVELLGEWSLARPQPRSQPGWFPGFGEGSYQKLNTDFFWAIGHMMQGPYSDLAQDLCDAYLVRPDGECNLAVAYIVAFGGEDRSGKSLVTECIDAQLADAGITGDQRATWLIAKAFAAEVPAGRGRPSLRAGRRFLEEATLVADTDAHQRWANEELVSRLAASGRTEAAKERLQSVAGLFRSTPNEKERLDAAINALAERQASEAESDAQAAESAYRAELARRRQASTAMPGR